MKKAGLFPSPAEYPESRLFSLDLLRGIDMFYLAVFAFVGSFYMLGFFLVLVILHEVVVKVVSHRCYVFMGCRFTSRLGWR